MRKKQFIGGGNFMDSKERREGIKRRVEIERRLVNDPTYHGPQRRRILDRRCGIDRRQIL
jgi:hypothetical protein